MFSLDKVYIYRTMYMIGHGDLVISNGGLVISKFGI